jgi:hypothetical protein
MSTSTGNLLAETQRLEKKYPGVTIVLNAQTLEVLVKSKSHAAIARKLKSLDKNVVPVFIGGPVSHSELAFHHFCKPAKAS